MKLLLVYLLRKNQNYTPVGLFKLKELRVYRQKKLCRFNLCPIVSGKLPVILPMMSSQSSASFVVNPLLLELLVFIGFRRGSCDFWGSF